MNVVVIDGTKTFRGKCSVCKQGAWNPETDAVLDWKNIHHLECGKYPGYKVDWEID